MVPDEGAGADDTEADEPGASEADEPGASEADEPRPSEPSSPGDADGDENDGVVDDGASGDPAPNGGADEVASRFGGEGRSTAPPRAGTDGPSEPDAGESRGDGPNWALDAPQPEAFAGVFDTLEVRTEGDRIYYFGQALTDEEALRLELWPTFDEAGYAVTHTERGGEDVLVAQPTATGTDGIPWTHLLLFVLTIGSTLVAGSMWFYVDPIQNPGGIWRGWPFSVGILTVLGIHELGHYVMTRHHDVDATLPYFIPVPTLIGTMGAVIKMKGRMPNRRALFDIGVAGPLAGLVAAIVVTVIGLHLDPVTAPQSVAEAENTTEIAIGFPPLMEFLAWATGQPLYYEDPLVAVHPLVIAGWVGMLVTFLNLIPVGQLDGGHIVRSIAPRHHERLAAVVPIALFGLAIYLLVVRGLAPRNVSIWILWGILALVVGRIGGATPIDDDTELDAKRQLVGVGTLLLGLACFTPVPIAVLG